MRHRNNFLPATLFAALAAFVGLVLCAERRGRIWQDERDFAKDQIRTWNDEGGNIPDVPTVTPGYSIGEPFTGP